MILLVKPEAAENGFSLDMALKTEPLELEYIKAMLKEFDVESIIYEASFDRRSFDEVFREYTPDAVAVTVISLRKTLCSPTSGAQRSCVPAASPWWAAHMHS